MKQIHIPVLLFSLLIGQTALATQVYKWTDNKGVTHFSDSPPPTQANEKQVISLPDVKAPVPKPQYGDTTQVEKQPLSQTKSSTLDSSSNSEAKTNINSQGNTVGSQKTEQDNNVSIKKKITLDITNLQNDQTIRSSRGFINVQIELSQKLGIGQSLQLIMDTQPYGAPQTPALWELKNIDRGTHTFSVNVVESGKVIASSNTITVHLHRTTVK